MSRRHAAEKRQILPDPKFGDLVLSKFTNNLMQHGKKFVAEKIVYGALEILDKKAANENYGSEEGGEDAAAIGISHRTENGKHNFKFSGTFTNSDNGVSGGYSYNF